MCRWCAVRYLSLRPFFQWAGSLYGAFDWVQRVGRGMALLNGYWPNHGGPYVTDFGSVVAPRYARGVSPWNNASGWQGQVLGV
jgi:hypothetical protein